MPPGKYTCYLSNLSDAYPLLDSAETISQLNEPSGAPSHSPTPAPSSPPSPPPFRFASVQPRGHITHTATPPVEDDSEPDEFVGLTEEQLEDVLGDYEEDTSYFLGASNLDEDDE